MKETKVSSVFKSDIERVWEKLANYEDYGWRDG